MSKLNSIVNGSWALYSALMFLILPVAALVIYPFKLLTGGTEFDLQTAGIIFVICLISGLIGYALLRVGIDEMKK